MPPEAGAFDHAGIAPTKSFTRPRNCCKCLEPTHYNGYYNDLYFQTSESHMAVLNSSTTSNHRVLFFQTLCCLRLLRFPPYSPRRGPAARGRLTTGRSTSCLAARGRRLRPCGHRAKTLAASPNTILKRSERDRARPPSRERGRGPEHRRRLEHWMPPPSITIPFRNHPNDPCFPCVGN